MKTRLHFELDGLPCIIEKREGKTVRSHIYKIGEGFVDGPEMTILSAGIPISKEEFTKLLVSVATLSGGTQKTV